MASVTTLKNGTRRVDFKGLDGKRRYIRLGDTSDKAARLFCARVESILEAAALGHSLDPRRLNGWPAGRKRSSLN